MFSFIQCKITRGGFSSERVFRLDVSGNPIVGIAHVDFVLKEDGSPIGDEPPASVAIDGYVQCRIVRRTGKETVLIELPSAELVEVPTSTLTAADELLAA